MTKDEIEYLRENVEAGHFPDFVRDTSLRLIAEREALLEALKAAADKLLWANSNLMHSWAQERPCDHGAAVEANEGEIAARAAIAKAEAE